MPQYNPFSIQIVTPFGSVLDHLRDFHLKGTVPPGVTPDVNSWHPYTGIAAEACVESLYYLGTPTEQENRLLVVDNAVYTFNLSSLAGPVPYYVGLNLDVEIMSGGVLYGPISIVFTPGSGVLPANPGTWRPSHVRQFIHDTIVAAGVLPLHPAYCTLSDEDVAGPPGTTGRLRIWCRNTQPGDYIRVLDTTDDLVLDILGFYHKQIAYCPQPVTIGGVQAAMFDLPGALDLGLELLNPGDSFYFEVVNRALLNLGEDLRTLRAQMLHLRDGVFGESDIPVQAAFIGVKRFDDDVHISWGNQTSREYGDNKSKLYLDYLASTLPSGARVAGSPATWIQTDRPGGGGGGTYPNWNNRVFGMEFDGWTIDPLSGGMLPLDGWSFIAEVHNSAAIAPDDVAYSAFGSQFMISAYSDTDDGAGGGSTALSVLVTPAIGHLGYLYSHRVYNKWQPPYGAATFWHTGEALKFDVMHTDLGTGDTSGWCLRPERTDTVAGFASIDAGAPQGGLYYQLQFTNTTDTYTYGFQHRLPWLGGGAKPAWYYEGITFYNETINGAWRYEQAHFDNLWYVFQVEDLNSIPGASFMSQATTMFNTSWYAYSFVPVPFSLFTWYADGQIRMEVEGVTDTVPYALRLGQPVAPGPVTELVWLHDATAKTLLRWHEKTSFLVSATIDSVNDVGTVQHLIADYQAGVGTGTFEVANPTGNLLTITEVIGALPLSSTPVQTATLGRLGAQAKLLKINGHTDAVDAAALGWNIVDHRPNAYASPVTDPSHDVGALIVARGGVDTRELIGELADYYRVFTPNDYWWDIADAVENSWGYITLDAPLPSPPPPSWDNPIPLRHGTARGPLVCWAIESLGGNAYKYVMEGQRVQTGDTVYLPDGTSYTVVSATYQPKGTILFKSGQYLLRHRVTFTTTFAAGYFAPGMAVEQATGGTTYAAFGTVVEVDAARTWIDVVMSVGHWRVGYAVDRIAGPGVPKTIASVRFPFDIQDPMHREGAHLRLLGENGVTFVAHASVLRLAPTAKSGINIDYLMDDNSGLARGFRRQYGSDLGLTFENITFGGFAPYNDTHFGGSSVSYGYCNEHGVVLYQAMNVDSYYYGLRFENCRFMDRVAWFSDYAATPATEVRYELELDVLNSEIDPEFFLGHIVGSAYLVDMDRSILLVGSFKLGTYGRYPIADADAARRNETFGPAIVRSTFQNIRVTMPASRPMASSGQLRCTVPFAITGLVDTIFDHVVDVYLPDQETSVDWTIVGTVESSAWCDYAANVTVRDCDWPGQYLQFGAIYLTLEYDASIAAAIVPSPAYLVTEDGVVAQVFATSGGTQVAETRVINLGAESKVSVGGPLMWVSADKWLDHDPAITITAYTFRYIPSGGVHVVRTRAGRIYVHGANQDVAPATGDTWSGHDANDVTVSTCTFSSVGRASQLRSNLVATGTLGDFLGCKNVTWEKNRVQRLSWKAETTAAQFQQGASAHLVGFRCCGSFKSHGNEYRGKNAVYALRPTAPTLGAANQSRCGTSLYAYQGFFTISAEIEKDRIIYAYAGDAACGTAVNFPIVVPPTLSMCTGGDFYLALFCYVRSYRVHDNEMEHCGSGYGAGAYGAHTRPGFVGIVADVHLPGDTIDPLFQNWFADDTTDYMGAYLIEPPSWKISGRAHKNHLYDVVAPRGANISHLAVPPAHDAYEGDTNCTYPGMGGCFAAWVANSNYPPAAPLHLHARTWSLIDVTKNTFEECAAGDGGSVSASTLANFSGGDGGHFNVVAFVHRGEASYSILRNDDNDLTDCVAGDGQDAKRPTGVGDYYGGMGGAFAMTHLYGGLYAAGSAAVWDNATCDDGRLTNVISGAPGTEQGDPTYAGYVGSWNLVRTEVGAEAMLNGNCADRNEMTNCWVGAGVGGFHHVYRANSAPGAHDGQDNYELRHDFTDRVGASWAFLYVYIPDVTSVLGVGTTMGREFGANGNKYRCSAASAPVSQDEICFAICHLHCDITNDNWTEMPTGKPTTKKLFPYKEAKFADNQISINFLSNNPYTTALLFSNQDSYNLAHFFGCNLVFDNNKIASERWNLGANYQRYEHDFLCLPWHLCTERAPKAGNLMLEISGTNLTTDLIFAAQTNIQGIQFTGLPFIVTIQGGHPASFNVDAANASLELDVDNANIAATMTETAGAGSGSFEFSLTELGRVVELAFADQGIHVTTGHTCGAQADHTNWRFWVMIDRAPWGAISQVEATGSLDFGLQARGGGAVVPFVPTTDRGTLASELLTLDGGIQYRTWYVRSRPWGAGQEALTFEFKNNT